MRKILLITILVLGLAMLLWACKGKEEPAPPPTPKAETPASPTQIEPVAKPISPVAPGGKAKATTPVKPETSKMDKPTKMKAPVAAPKAVSIKKKKKDEGE